MRLASFTARVAFVFLVGSMLATADPARADDPQRAKELFQQGTTHFDLGQFDKAIESWQAGYKEKPDPGFLYNIAQAYRLAGDSGKAIFFYKGYLRNSPKAHNRAEVEQKIAALQKLVADQDRVRQQPPQPPPPAHSAPPPAVTAPPPPPSPAPHPAPAGPGVQAAPPPSPPSFEAQPAVPAAGPTSIDITSPPRATAAVVPGRYDLGAALGFDTWEGGISGAAEPSFAFTLTSGYTFSGGADRRTQLRLGALIGYTFLSERVSKPTFWSFLLEPELRWRISQRFSLSGALGFGLLAVGNIKPGSVLLVSNMPLRVSGTQSLFVLRPALGLAFRLFDSLGVTFTWAFPTSPKGENFHGDIRRTEVLFGLTYHL